MSLNPNLNLCSSYKFDIAVRSDNGYTCYGELELTPSKSSLRLFFESQEGRMPLFGLTIDSITCTTDDYTFILLNLERISGSGFILDSDTERIGFRKIEFSIESVLYLKTKLSSELTFIGIAVDSKDLISWIGKTTIQEDLLVGAAEPKIYHEIVISLEDEQTIYIDYTINSGLTIKELLTRY